MSNLVTQMTTQLDPLFTAVIDTLEAADNAYPMTFFTLLRMQLHSAQEELDVLQVFFDLSTTAFQGFVFSSAEAAVVDELLAACEHVSHTMTAPDNQQH